DLETICLKCLQKAPRQRYASALALAEDLHRFQVGESIQARPTPAWERGVQWARRRPALAALLGVSGAAVVTVMVVVLLANARLKQQRDATELARQDAEGHSRDAQAQRQLADANFQKARDAVDQMLTRVGQEQLAQMPRMERLRRDLLQEALRFYQEFVRQKSTDPVVRNELARAYWRLGEAHRQVQALGQAGGADRQAGATYQKVAEEFPTVDGYWNGLGVSYANLGNLLKDRGRYQEAEGALRQALVHQEKLAIDAPTVPNYRKPLAATYNTLGVVLWH